MMVVLIIYTQLATPNSTGRIALTVRRIPSDKP